MSFAQEEQLSAARNGPSMVAVDFSDTLDHHVQHTYQQQPVFFGHSSTAPVQHDGGYNSEPSIKYHTSFQNQLNDTSFLPHDHLIRNPQLSQDAENDYSGRLAPSPTETSTNGIQPGNCFVQPYSLNLFDDWSHNRNNGVEEFLSEEEIRIKSHEMLENEDMQQLLRIFSMGGQASVSTPEDGFSFPSCMPSPSLNYKFEEDRGRPDKAVVGWLKIKAAMRWGFFIRKKAAEKRAQLVELDGE